MTDTYANALETMVSPPQTQPIFGRESEMIQNAAGGYVFPVSEQTRLTRFLILGTESNTYYASSQELTINNAQAIVKMIQAHGLDVVETTAQISESGRAPKNDPALFVLALAMTYGDVPTRQAAGIAMTRIDRTGTHLLHLAKYVNTMRGWGRGVRKSFARWYTNKSPDALALQLIKYANRDGWTHRDVLRLVHPKATGAHQQLFAYVTNKAYNFADTELSDYMWGVNEVKSLSESESKDAVKRAAELIAQHKFPREFIPTELLNHPQVWEALLPHMGATALIRNLATLTRLGVLSPLSDNTSRVVEKLSDLGALIRAKVHPIQVLSAYYTYEGGASIRGNTTWTPVQEISNALDDAFYVLMNNTPPTGKRLYLGVDVSGSMGVCDIAGIPGLTPRAAAAVMASLVVRTEKRHVIKAFTNDLYDLPIKPGMAITDIIALTNNLPFGPTNATAIIQNAIDEKIPVDTFITYTDNETWSGYVHPSIALEKYRQKMGIPAKLISVAFTATRSSIADPKDSLMMDVVGFDSAAPDIMSRFITDSL